MSKTLFGKKLHLSLQLMVISETSLNILLHYICNGVKGSNSEVKNTGFAHLNRYRHSLESY